MKTNATLLLLLSTACVPPESSTPFEAVPPPPALTASPTTAGHDLTFRLTTGAAGAQTWLVWGPAAGPGPCPPLLGGSCLNVAGATLLGAAIADGAGVATFHLPIPLSAPVGAGAAFQGVAMVAGSAALSAVLPVTVADPVDLCDRSGGPAQSAACDLLGLINDERAQGRTCGARGVFAATHPLTMDDRLLSASEIHAGWMASTRTFSHASVGGPIGDTFVQRAEHEGYSPWMWLSETIERGSSTPAAALQGWLNSDPHCADLMDPRKRDIGIGRADAANGLRYWSSTQGEPR